MSRMIFEGNLERSMGALQGSDTPFLDEDVNFVMESLTVFAKHLHDDDDLEEHLTKFAEANEFDEFEAQWFADLLIEVAEHSGLEPTDDNLKGFLKSLSVPVSASTKTSPNLHGMTPLKAELGVKSWLRSLTVEVPPQLYGNKSLSPDTYKTFKRATARMGYDYSYDNDYNNQTNRYSPLANPTLNVRTEAFAVADVMGMGLRIPNGFRVVNVFDNSYASSKLSFKEASDMAGELNAEFNKELALFVEAGDSDGSGKQSDASSNPSGNGTSKLKTFGGAKKPFKTKKWPEQDKSIRAEEEAPVASTPITENILKPISPSNMSKYLAGFQRQKLMTSGSCGEMDHSNSPANALKDTARLINERKAKFDEDSLNSDELQAIQQISRKK